MRKFGQPLNGGGHDLFGDLGGDGLGYIQQFREARPFPHIVFDNLFPDSLLSRLDPELPDMFERSHWAFENSATLTRFNIRSPVELGAAGQQLIAFLHSAQFLYFLTELTGIANLLPDPYLRGGGYNKMPRAGFFQVHSDRNTAYDASFMRRLALIIYLNKDWPHEYGGQLELWRPGANACEVSFSNRSSGRFNRTGSTQTRLSAHSAPNANNQLERDGAIFPPIRS